jgi:hypothetical protein
MVSRSILRTADISVTNASRGRTISHAARDGSGRHPPVARPLTQRRRTVEGSQISTIVFVQRERS